jgi:hypothetical protein
MTQNEAIRRLIDDKEANCFTSMEFWNHMLDQLWKLPAATRPGVLAELSAHADEDVRRAALDFQTFARHDALSKDLDYVRQHSPLRPGTRLELFGGYDYHADGGKLAWLNGQECYRATFLGFAARGDGMIPAALVAFDEPVDVPGHKGRYGILLGTYGLDSIAWGRTDDVVEVHVTDVPPDGVTGDLTGDLRAIRFARDPVSALETHATCRVEGTD